MLTNSIFFSFQCIFIVFGTFSFIAMSISYFSNLDGVPVFFITSIFNILIVYLIRFFKKNLEINRSNFINLTLIGWFLIVLVGVVPLFDLLENSTLNEKIFFSTSLATTTGFDILNSNFSNEIILSLWAAVIQNIGALYTLMIFIIYSSLFLNRSFFLSKRNIIKLKAVFIIFLSFYTLILFIFKYDVIDSFTLASSILSSSGYRPSSSIFLRYDTNYYLIITLMIISLFLLPVYLFVPNKKIFRIIKKMYFKYKTTILFLLIIFLICLVLLLNTELSLAKNFCVIISLITTTGVLPEDFQNINIIESYKKFFFIFLFISVVGSFSGTTNGGIKLNKLSLFFISIKEELNKFLYQHNIKGLEILKKGSSQTELNTFYSLIICSLIFIFISTLIFNLEGMSLKASFINIIAALTNTGESLLVVGGIIERVNPNYYFILNILMICGRFEFIGYLLLLKKILK